MAYHFGLRDRENSPGRIDPFGLPETPALPSLIGQELDDFARLSQVVGTERESVWTEVRDTAPGYGRYEEKTDREIPLFRLTLRS